MVTNVFPLLIPRLLSSVSLRRKRSNAPHSYNLQPPKRSVGLTGGKKQTLNPSSRHLQPPAPTLSGFTAPRDTPEAGSNGEIDDDELDMDLRAGPSKAGRRRRIALSEAEDDRAGTFEDDDFDMESRAARGDETFAAEGVTKSSVSEPDNGGLNGDISPYDFDLDFRAGSATSGRNTSFAVGEPENPVARGAKRGPIIRSQAAQAERDALKRMDLGDGQSTSRPKTVSE